VRAFTGFAICLLFVFWCLGFSAVADDLGDQLLKQGIGVRAAGMGGAYSAIAEDASAVFYNPAGLASPGFGYTYGSLDSNKTKNEFTYSLIKLGYIGYSEGKIQNPAGDLINYSAVGFGNRAGWLNWGTNYKNLSWNISGVQNEGWTADIGLLLRITPQLRLALVGQDILTTKSRLVPASARIGFSLKPMDGQLVLAGDAEIYKSLLSYGHFGIEANLVRGLSLRAGIDRSRPTAGISVDMSAFTLDYAVLFNNDGGGIQRFEAGIKLLPGKERPFSLIKPKEFALIDVGGAIKAGETEYSLFGGIQPGLDSILESIRAASKDKSIDGIFLRIRGFSGGLGGAAMVQEMRAEIDRARQKGKKIVAYIEGSAIGDEYYLASAADQIVAAPGSAVGGFGRSIEIYRMNGLFQKLGISWEVIAKGKYKTVFDWLSPRMSSEQKEMAEGLVEDIYRQMLSDISASRKIKIEKIKEIGDGMVFPARLAQKMGLIDRVGYFRDASMAASELYGSKDEVKIITPNLLEPETTFFTQMFGVAIIEVNGEIISGAGGSNFIFGGNYVGSDQLARNIRRAAEDPFVKAIVIRIDSPGGTSVAAGEIYKSLQYAREKKKVIIASMGSIAASGGYYIAAAADKIVADRSTITGSIGVLSYMPDISEMLNKFGVKTDVIKEGSHADMFSGLRKLTTVEAEAMERLIDENYQEFVDVVAAGRKLPTKEVEALAQGRIFTGNQALAAKLIDKLGGFLDAVDVAKDEAKIMGEPRLIYYRDVSPFIQIGTGVSSALGLPPLLPQSSGAAWSPR